ncbi:DNA nickase [compost metagenome]
MDATKLLIRQHDEVKQLFKECESLGESEFKRRSEIVEQITQKLRLHTQIEEEILYPAVKGVDTELVLECFEEHHMVKILLEELENTPPSNERYLAKLSVLQEMVEHHIKEEEGTLFPEIRDKCGMEKIDAFGTQLQQRFEELLKGVAKSR